MAFLARKITRAKWAGKEGLATSEIAADAVTADLRTSNNALSFWKCSESSEKELGEVILALAAGADRIDRIELVWLDEQRVTEESLATRITVGNTPVEELRHRHVDIEKLDYVRLGKVANLVRQAIDSDCLKRFTAKEVLQLVAAAVRNKRLHLPELPEKVRSQVEKTLPA